MFDITCPRCAKRFLVGTRSMTALRNTVDGPVAHVQCPNGHAVVHHFRPLSARRRLALGSDEPLEAA